MLQAEMDEKQGLLENVASTCTLHARRARGS